MEVSKKNYYYLIKIIIIIIAYILSLPTYSEAESEEQLQYWYTTSLFKWAQPSNLDAKHYSISINGTPSTDSHNKIKQFKGAIHITIPLEQEKATLIVINEQNNPIYSADIFFAPSYLAELVPEQLGNVPVGLNFQHYDFLRKLKLAIEINQGRIAKQGDTSANPGSKGVTFSDLEAALAGDSPSTVVGANESDMIIWAEVFS